MPKSISDIRRDYGDTPLIKQHINPNPFTQFEQWLNAAVESELLDPTAFSLATVDENQCPDARMLLLKGIMDEKFIFYSNNQSHKGAQLQHNPNAAMNFYWAPWSRQVRVRGVIEMVDQSISEQYFKSRPIDSQISAIISEQSQVIPNRALLEEKAKAYKDTHQADEITCPAHWQGYALVPSMIEFFQGRDNRLHDRIRFQKSANGWVMDRLSP